MTAQMLERYAREFDNLNVLKDHYEWSLGKSEILKDILLDEKVKEFKAAAALTKRKPHHKVRCVAKQHQQQKLIEDFGQYYDLEFLHADDREPHAYAREHRRLTERFVYDKYFLYDNKTRVPAGFDCLVKDVGGNPWKHIVGKRRLVHSCCPILDANDSLRNATYNRLMANNNLTDPMMRVCLEDHLRCDPRVICNTKSQFCDIKSKYIMFLHSSYDIGLKEMATIMARANAEFAMVALIFHEKVLLDQSGYIEDQEIYFRKYVRKGILMIDFYFKNDHQNGYTHRFDVYIALITSFRLSIEWQDGMRYYDVSCVSDKSSVRLYQIQQVTARVVPPCRMFRVLTSQHYEDKLVVYTWDYLTLVERDIRSRDNMVAVRMVVPKRLFEDIYLYGLTLTDTRFLPKNLMNAAVSFNSKEVIDGQTIGTKERLGAVQLSLLVYTIYHLLYINNYEKSQLLVRLQRDENRVRGGRCWLSRFLGSRGGSKPETIDKIRSSDSAGHLLENKGEDGAFLKFIRADEKRKFDITAVSVEMLDCLTVTEELEYISTVTNPRAFSAMAEVVSLDEMFFPTEKLRAYISDQFQTTETKVEEEKIDCNLEQINCEKNCTRDLVAVETPGDGNCGFHALRLSGATADSPALIRARLRASPVLSRFAQKDQVADSLVDGTAERNWATLDTMCLFAHEYGVQICVHLEDTTIIRVGKPSDKVYCVLHLGNHWEALVERKELDPVIERKWSCDTEKTGMTVEVEACDIDVNLREIESACFDGGSISKARYRQARTALYDLEQLGSSGYLCRSALKLRELFYRYPEIVPRTGTDVMDLCAGPGSWTQVLLDTEVKTVFGITNSRMIDYSVTIKDPRLNIVRAIIPEDGVDPGDILHPQILNGLMEIVNESSASGISLVVADGMTCSEDDRFDEFALFDLMRHEVVLAFFTMHEGANFVLKGVRPTTLYSAAIYGVLVEAFHSVTLVRLDTSRPSSGEFYYVCMGFLGVDDPQIFARCDVHLDTAVEQVWRGFAVDVTRAQVDFLYRVRALAMSDKKDLDFSHGNDRAPRYRSILSRKVKGGYLGKTVMRWFRRNNDAFAEYLKKLDELRGAIERNDSEAMANAVRSLQVAFDEYRAVRPLRPKKTYASGAYVCGEKCFNYVKKKTTKVKEIYTASVAAVINSVDEFVVRAVADAEEVYVPYRNDIKKRNWWVKTKQVFKNSEEGLEEVFTLDSKTKPGVRGFSPSNTALDPIEPAIEASDVAVQEMITPVCVDSDTKTPEDKKKPSTIVEEAVGSPLSETGEGEVFVTLMNLSFSCLNDSQELFIRGFGIKSDEQSLELGENLVVEKEKFSVALVCQDSDGVTDYGAVERCLSNLREFLDRKKIAVVNMTRPLDWDKLESLFAACLPGVKIKLFNAEDKSVLYQCALAEYRAYLVSVHDAETSNHIRLYSKIKNMGRVEEIVRGEQNNYGVLKKGSFFVAPKVRAEKYRMCFVKNVSGYAFVTYEEAVNYELAIVSDYCRYMLEPEFVAALDKLDKRTSMPSVGFIQAAPGSGKTTLILKEHKPANGENPSLVLLSTTEGKLDFRRRAEKTHGFTLDDKMNRYYRTAASYLINPDVKSETLYIDEVLMHHPGMIIALILLSGARNVYLLGDQHQIPFVNRNKTFKCKYNDLMRFFKVTRTLGITYRCPQDVTKILTRDYNGLRSARPVLRSLEIEKITTVLEVPKDEKSVYLTFTQAEKEELARHVGKAVFTVHEFQGKEAPTVFVVRLSPREQDAIYNRSEYPRVAISRANTRTVYYTACTSDVLSSWIKEARDLTDGEISSVYVRGGFSEPVRLTYEKINLARPNEPIATLDLTNNRLFSSDRDLVVFVPRKGYYGKDYGYGGYRKGRVLRREIDGRRVYEIFSGSKPSLIEVRESLREFSTRYRGDAISATGEILHSLDEQLLSNVFRKHLPGVPVRLHMNTPIGQVHPNVFYLLNRNGIAGIPNDLISDIVEETPASTVKFTSGVKFNLVITTEAVGELTEITDVYRMKKVLYVRHRSDTDKLLSIKNMRTVEKAIALLPGNIRVGFDLPERLETAYIDHFRASKYSRKFILEGEEEKKCECDHGMIQEIVRKCLPGTYTSSSEFDTWMVHNYDFNLAPGACIYRKYPVLAPRAFDTLLPVLDTPVPRLRDYTSRETLLAYYKRNACVPQLTGIVAFTEHAETMMRNFAKELLDRETFLNVTREKIRVSEVEIDEWLEKQDSVVLDQIFPDASLAETSLDNYEFSIKRQPKPNLTLNAGKAYVALQTIVYHPKTVNAIFCVIFRQMKKRLLACLKKHVKIYCDVSPDEFARELDDSVPFVESFRWLDKIEVDISKYDKSQREIALELEVRLMAMFGVPDEYIRLWEKAHIVSTLKCRGTGFRAVVNYQRKSGDASTFLGNTMFLMAVLATEMPLSRCSMVLFSGDDSLIYGSDLGGLLDAQRLALIYNLECKIFRFEHSYFCSKFLIPVRGRWVFVPDPVKVAVKLGRSDLKNLDHLEEYRISLKDNNRGFSDDVVCAHVAEALRERYKVHVNLAHNLKQLYFVTHPENIRNLYYIPENAVLDKSIVYSRF